MTPLQMFRPLLSYLAVCGVLAVLAACAMPEAERRGCVLGWLILLLVNAGGAVVLWRTAGTLVVIAPCPEPEPEPEPWTVVLRHKPGCAWRAGGKCDCGCGGHVHRGPEPDRPEDGHQYL